MISAAPTTAAENTRVGSKAQKDVPDVRAIQNVLSSREEMICLTTTQRVICRGLVLLEKNSPYNSPVTAAVTVYPGKYGPMGRRVAPIKSEQAPTTMPPKGP